MERFWSKVDKSGECWLWTASCFGTGYGKFRMGRRLAGAHRVAYMLTYGAIPKGFYVLHKCDNPLCVNPDHLRLGTHTDNMADRNIKGRASAARGEKNGKARLTVEQVRGIRARYAAGNVSYRALAREYGVSPTCVGQIVRRERWRHVK